MSQGGFCRLRGLFGPAVLLVLGCSRGAISDVAGADTGSTSADDGGSTGDSSSGGASSGTGSTGTGSSGTGSSGTGTGTTIPPCGVVQLADVALGIGGFALDGEAEWDQAGRSVSGAGDVNGDGLADVIVGAPYTDYGEWCGRAYVVFGKANTDAVSLADVAQGIGGFALGGDTGPSAPERAGFSVSGAGDVNGDGVFDVVVGAPYAWVYSGRAYVVFGKADTDPVSLADVVQGIGGFAMDGGAVMDQSGYSVSGAGDVNGDGLADVVVGAPRADMYEGQSGRAYVVFGKVDTTLVSLADVTLGTGGFAMHGEVEGDESGYSVSGAGDVNGDGLADVVVGAPKADPSDVVDSGRAYVVFGKADTTLVSLADVALGIGGFALDGATPDDESGRSVGGAGDVNGDGLADVIVGAPGADLYGNNSGLTYVVFGKADTEATSLAEVAQGIGGFVVDGEVEDTSGRPVSGAGDINADGLADVVVGTPRGSVNGRTYVVFGKADTEVVSLADVRQGVGGFAMDGEAAGDNAGASASGAGDVNGDGIPDIIVGAPDADPNGIDRAGRTYVVFGGDFSCAGG